MEAAQEEENHSMLALVAKSLAEEGEEEAGVLMSYWHALLAQLVVEAVGVALPEHHGPSVLLASGVEVVAMVGFGFARRGALKWLVYLVVELGFARVLLRDKVV